MDELGNKLRTDSTALERQEVELDQVTVETPESISSAELLAILGVPQQIQELVAGEQDPTIASEYAQEDFEEADTVLAAA